MTKYSHLSQEQRYQIEALLIAGKNFSEIALQIGFHRATISREIRRNSTYRQGGRSYGADKAHKKTLRRHHHKPKYTKFSSAMKGRVLRWLKQERFSPEIMSKLGRQFDQDFVSHEAIYQWIWNMKDNHFAKNRPYKHLYRLLKNYRRHRKRGNKRDSRGHIPHRISIERRPTIVNDRRRLGDLEVDLVLGLHHQPGLIVLLDRTSLKTQLIKLATRDSRLVANKIIRRLRSSRWVKTLTYDNDISFYHHQKINKELGTKSFFTRPFTSQDKGSVENRIGIIRRFFPKRTDFTKVSAQRISAVETMLNDRPIRKFSYKSANQVFMELAKI
jgi:transposase, IS30 family